MTEPIILREFQKLDSGALEDIIRETWNYDRFTGPKTAAKLAKVYLNSCLTNQTFTRTALLGGTPVGIIMGKHIPTHKCPLKYRLRLIGSIISLYLSKEGRSASKIFGNVSGIDKELLASCSTNYQGEVAFFAISAACRGKGLGKKLFAALLQYMKQEQVHDFYLFTDTSCNYSFYEHQGMIRRCEKNHSFQLAGQQSDMHFFLYDFHLQG